MEAEAEAVEAALKSTASTSLVTRLDITQLKSRTDGQGPYLRSLDHLGRSSEVKEIKSLKTVKLGPTEPRTDGQSRL